MSISYRREINHNYLIIDSSEAAAVGYECRMLVGNTIDGLLKFRVRHHEDKKEFYYEITSKQPLSRLLEQRTITGDEIRNLILEISGLVGRLEEFLLREDQILLEPEYIYIEPDHFSAFFCMVPGQSGDFPSALTALFEYLLSKVNHQDKDGVMLAYNLYHESLKENYGMQDLLGFLSEKSGGIFEAEKPGSSRWEFEVNRSTGTYRPAEADRETEFTRSAEADSDSVTAINRAVKADRVIKANRATTAVRRIAVADRRAGKMSLGKMVLRFLMLTAVGEVSVWFMMGMEGLIRYGIWILAAAIVLSGIFYAASALSSVKKADLIKTDVEKHEERHEEKQDAIGQAYKIVQKEDKEEYWTDWKESDKMETVTDPQTELLADLDKPNRFAVMESLNKAHGSIEITYLPFVIGKHEELSDYCLHHPTVSRLHLRIDKKEEVYIVTDLNSTNGTLVEGYHLQANETVSIKNGDIIYLADAGFRFVEDKL